MIDKDAICRRGPSDCTTRKRGGAEDSDRRGDPPALAEAGVSVFRLHEDIEHPGHFLLYERFASQAALDSHFASSHFKKVIDAVGPLVGGGKPNILMLRQLTE
jgi:quinol monooxygenase YgiN